jgi:hypothetical protein
MKPRSEWPHGLDVSSIIDDDSEVKMDKPVVSYLTDNYPKPATDVLLERYSSWYRLKIGVAWILKLKYLLLCKVRKKSACEIKTTLSVTELKEAEVAVIKYVQGQHFKDEISTVMAGDTLRHGSLYKLRPTLLADGLLCIGGRLRKAVLPESQRHPIILPKYHHVVDLIIRSYHESSGHTGREHVLSLVREQFCVISGRQAVRRVLQKCFTCRRNSAQPATQLMADLPSCRLQADHPPFTYLGVDLFGPIIIKRGRTEYKRYGCLFTCLTVRAIHLEVCQSLETDSFINALQRFISRRGEPAEIWCDNGTNFVGAEKQLRQSLQKWNQTQIDKFLMQRGISWHFNPPKASHMGGCWERMIRSVRKILGPLLKEQVMDDEGLATMLCMVEAIINGRPLTTVSDDPNDLTVLSPNQLLNPKMPYQLPPGIFQKEDKYVRRRWRQVQYFCDVFWRRWTREYLPMLQSRAKWIEKKPNIAVGDLVLLVEETPRNHWPLARVLDVFPGDDGNVRAVRVKTQSTILERPIRKICHLESTD